jgi:hypothetical protein
MHQNAGFVHSPESARLDRLKAAGAISSRFPFLDRFRIIGNHLTYLHRLLDWADAHGVTVVVVDMPVSADLEERMYPEAFDRYRTTLAELGRSRNVRVLRASREAVGLGDADFADWVHLNGRGSARLSAWLRRELAKGPPAAR